MDIDTTLKHLTELGYGLHGKGTAMVLGTGLGGMVDEIEVVLETAYESIPGFPEATVEFHKGKLIQGRIGGHQVLVMQGRYHYYEGYSMKEISFPIRIMKALGAERLILSNAAGCINRGWEKGDLMLVEDHIDLLPEDPFRGTYDVPSKSLGMIEAYDMAIRQKLILTAKNLNITLRQGVYAAVKGPNLETAAEYRMIHRLGADIVGMSTVPEVKVANQIGLPCVAISVLTDMCNYDNLQPIDIQDIISTALKSEKKLIALTKEYLKKLS